MMKKIYVFLCMLILSLSILSGCGGSESDTEEIIYTNEETLVENVVTEEVEVEKIETNTSENEEGSVEVVVAETDPEIEAVEIVEENKVEFTYLELSKTMYPTTQLKIRSLPNKDGEQIGIFSKGEAVEVTGKCNESGWYRVKFGSAVGYVSDSYMSDSKPVVVAPAPVPKEELQQQVQSQPEQAQPEQAPQSNPSGGLVWKSATGEKYHSINNCGRMNPAKATQITLAEAQSLGLGQCSKCW